MNLYQQYKHARQEAFSCAGWKIQAIRERLRYSYYTFHQNWKDLEGWFEHATGNEGTVVAAWAFFDNERKFLFLRELERRLHNFCASAQTLVEHTRTTRKRLRKFRDVSNELKQLNQANFANDGATQFVLKLRIYLTHYDPVSVQYSLEWRDGNLIVPFRFRKALLLKWRGWKALAKRFLEQSEPTLEIRPLLSAFHAREKVYYDQLFDKHEEWFAAELSELERLWTVAVEMEKKLKKFHQPPTSRPGPHSA